MAQHLDRTGSLFSESSTSPSMLHRLGIATSPNNHNPESPNAEDHKLLDQLIMLPEDVEAMVQDQVSFVVTAVVSLARKTLIHTRRHLISWPFSQSWRVRRACIAIVCHRL